MKSKSKKIFAIFLVLTLIFSMSSVSFADTTDVADGYSLADFGSITIAGAAVDRYTQAVEAYTRGSGSTTPPISLFDENSKQIEAKFAYQGTNRGFTSFLYTVENFSGEKIKVTAAEGRKYTIEKLNVFGNGKTIPNDPISLEKYSFTYNELNNSRVKSFFSRITSLIRRGSLRGFIFDKINLYTHLYSRLVRQKVMQIRASCLMLSQQLQRLMAVIIHIIMRMTATMAMTPVGLAFGKNIGLLVQMQRKN